MEIKEETINQILNYLATRPYIEVAKLINDITQQANVEIQKKEEEKKED